MLCRLEIRRVREFKLEIKEQETLQRDKGILGQKQKNSMLNLSPTDIIPMVSYKGQNL